MLITPEMVTRTYQRIRQQRHAISTVCVEPVLIEDDRPKLPERARKRMQDRGLQFSPPAGPLTVVMMEEIMHTEAFPVCADPTCICSRLEREAIIAETTPRRRRRKGTLIDVNCEPSRADAAALNGNRGFSLLK